METVGSDKILPPITTLLYGLIYGSKWGALHRNEQDAQFRLVCSYCYTVPLTISSF